VGGLTGAGVLGATGAGVTTGTGAGVTGTVGATGATGVAVGPSVGSTGMAVGEAVREIGEEVIPPFFPAFPNFLVCRDTFRTPRRPASVCWAATEERANTAIKMDLENMIKK